MAYRWGRPGQLHQLRDAAGISAKDDGGSCGWRALVQGYVQKLWSKSLGFKACLESLPAV